MERGLFYKFRTVIYIFLVAVMAGVIFCIYPANTQIREWHMLLKNNIKDIKKYFDYIHIFERVFLKNLRNITIIAIACRSMYRSYLKYIISAMWGFGLSLVITVCVLSSDIRMAFRLLLYMSLHDIFFGMAIYLICTKKKNIKYIPAFIVIIGCSFIETIII